MLSCKNRTKSIVVGGIFAVVIVDLSPLAGYGSPLSDVTVVPGLASPSPVPKVTRIPSEDIKDQGLKPQDTKLKVIGLSVEKNRKVVLNIGEAKSTNPGEIQSTVIPPNKKRQCPQGRLLISNDAAKNPGSILWLNLDNLDGAPSEAKIEGLPSTDYMIASNDHDLLTLNNGDVLYVRMGRSKKALTPKPAWFDHAYKLKDLFGPGARSAILVWRSIDGGENFEFLSVIDTAQVDDGWGTLTDWSGAFPQNTSSTDPPGSPRQPIWGMGGTDGPLATVDRATGRAFVVLQLKNNLPDTSKPYFAVSDTALMRSAVMMSSDGGESWETAGMLGFRGWRTEVVARPNDLLAFGSSGWDEIKKEGSSFIRQEKIGQFSPQDETTMGVAAPEVQGKWGWEKLPWDHPLLYKYSESKDSTDHMKVMVAGQTILTRSPSSKNLLLALMDTIEGGKGDGYRLFLTDGSTSWTALPSIVPAGANKDNFILHLTPIDLGVGPVLFYWYDVNTVTKEATIRGRLITRDDRFTENFTISRKDSDNGLRHFSVLTDDWYGDYHTAGGYVEAPRPGSQFSAYNYFPVWIEPDGYVHFTRIRFSAQTPQLLLDPDVLNIKLFWVSPKDRRTSRRQVEVFKLQMLDTLEPEDHPR
jgi:hypothetical protein